MSDTDQETTRVCRNGHEHAVEDLDKIGMDKRCPECGVVV